MTPADIPAIRFLFKEVFRKKVSDNYLQRKYDTDWCGLKHVAWLAFHDGKPVAMYGALPQRFRQGGETFLGVHTCDSFTLESHQRKGLHQDLALNAYEFVRREGVRFVYAYHSEATYHSCKKLGWLEGSVMKGFWLPTGAWGWSRFRNKLNPDFFPGAWKTGIASEGFHNSFSASPFMHVDYGQDFLEYKSFSPNGVIRAGNATFWVKTGAVLMVGDGFAATRTALEGGIRALQKLAARQGFSRILFQTHPESDLSHALAMIPEAVSFDSWLVGYLPLQEGLDWKGWRGNYADLDTF